MKPSLRKPVGVLLILLLITVWAVIVVTLVGLSGNLPVLVQIAIYLVAGIVWIFPLKPLLIWMESGPQE